MTDKIDNDILEKYKDIGGYIGKTKVTKNTDLNILKNKIDLLNSPKSNNLFLFIKDKILKL